MTSPGPTTAAVGAVVVGGYLGAGKTTLVNEVLRQADGTRIAVLVNDFGELAIDADLVVGASGEVVALAGGCVCCSFGADLIGTLRRVLDREPPPQRVLVECSGVGLPGVVARSLRLLPQLDVRGVVTVLDAATAIERAADRYVGDTVRAQIDEADRLVLNQIDRCDAARVEALRRWLAETAPSTPVCEAAHGALPAEWLWEVSPRAAAPRHQPVAVGRLAPVGAQAERCFRSETLHVEPPADPQALAAQLTRPGSDVERAKGWIVDADRRSWLLQVASGRAELTQRTPPAASRAANRLLVIRSLRSAAAA
ncbi:MAG: GTP-binding protein [Burkholderiaceae bacterium]